MATGKKKYWTYLIYGIVIGLFIWPTSRAIFQQQLMRIGFFQPKYNDVAVVDQGTQHLDVASFVTADGQVINTIDLKGKVVFINFWATWCGPCIAEMPSIQVLYDKFKNNPDVVFLVVEVDSNKEGALQFMNKKNLHLPLVFPNSTIPTAWLDGTIPSTVLLNKSGILVDRKQGMYDYSGSSTADYIQRLIDQK